MTAKELITEIKKSLFLWYDLPKDAKVYIFDKDSVKKESGNKYDYIFSKKDIELYENPMEFLEECKFLLKENGHLLLAVNNRFGIKYFCGDKDTYTKKCFDGINNYIYADCGDVDLFRGRTYTKAELKRFLKKAGFSKWRFFSVFSDLDNPSLIYRDDFVPNEDLIVRTFPTYQDPEIIFLEERLLYKDLIDNNMFHQMANAFIIECTMDENVLLSDVKHVTSSLDRGENFAMQTIIHDSGWVEKRAVYEEGKERLEKLYKNGAKLRARGVKTIPATYENGTYQMPFVDLENGQVYLKRLLHEDINLFLVAMDKFRDTILNSSNLVENLCDGNSLVLEQGYFDMVPLNSFFDGTDFVFFDQEFCEENYPANVLIWRLIATLYAYDDEMDKLMPRERLFERYHLLENLEKWKQMELDFLDKLRNKNALEEYHEKIRTNPDRIQHNRERMNYSAEFLSEYHRTVYRDIFHNLDSKSLVLFGSGVYAERFWQSYHDRFQIIAIVDNQESKWGTEWHGIPISSPDLLRTLPADEYKVMICVLSYAPIIEQLQEMGVKEYSVYDVQHISGSLVAALKNEE